MHTPFTYTYTCTYMYVHSCENKVHINDTCMHRTHSCYGTLPDNIININGIIYIKSLK
jgi:hypothetical protein